MGLILLQVNLDIVDRVQLVRGELDLNSVC